VLVEQHNKNIVETYRQWQFNKCGFYEILCDCIKGYERNYDVKETSLFRQCV